MQNITRDNLDDELAKLVKQMMGVMVEKERTGYLGYQKGHPITPSGERGSDHRNGHYPNKYYECKGYYC